MVTLLLPGWSQSPEMLRTMVSGEVVSLDYHAYPDYTALCEAVPIRVDQIIGWSLGGQLAARLIADGKVHAATLTLIAAPFQFVSCARYEGTSKDMYDGFYQSMERHPQRTYQRFCRMIAQGDENPITPLQQTSYPHLLPWLAELGRFSCCDLDMQNFPPVTLIHGDNDAVVPVGQVRYWEERLPVSTTKKIAGKGHWPMG